MDVEAAYAELMDLTNQALSGVDVDTARMAELIESIDGWIRYGGYLPAAWASR